MCKKSDTKEAVVTPFPSTYSSSSVVWAIFPWCRNAWFQKELGSVLSTNKQTDKPKRNDLRYSKKMVSLEFQKLPNLSFSSNNFCIVASNHHALKQHCTVLTGNWCGESNVLIVVYELTVHSQPRLISRGCLWCVVSRRDYGEPLLQDGMAACKMRW